MRRAVVVVSLIALGLVSCGRGPKLPVIPVGNPQRVSMTLKSPAFANGEEIPKANTCAGKDASPPLAWSGAPESVRSFAVLCDDPRTPQGIFTHWIVYNIPAATKELPEGLAPEPQVKLGTSGTGVMQGLNDFGKVGYGGPCPPSGSHRYLFRVYALDTTLNLAPGASREQFIQAITDHIVVEGRLSGISTR
ncbi:YbhB/YbcL family Raf kinase inhibitor-like protein [Singulisphaera rosea]